MCVTTAKESRHGKEANVEVTKIWGDNCEKKIYGDDCKWLNNKEKF